VAGRERRRTARPSVAKVNSQPAGKRATVALISGALNVTARIAPPVAGRACLALFRRPRVRAKLSPWEQPVVDDAHRDSMTVGGKAVVIYRWGSGERPVLLVHGWQSRASRFAGFVPLLLARGYSPIAFDAPGHGDSGGNATTILEYRDIIGRLNEKYGAFEAIVAHSFGVLAAFVALREGAGVKAHRLVAISGVSEFGYLVDGFCVSLRLHPQLNSLLRGQIEQNLFPGEANIWERFSATSRPDGLVIPILVVHDEKDDMADISQAQRIVEAYGEQVRTVITHDLGHRTLRDASVIGAVDRFVGCEDRPTSNQ
jgi:pimeloyl-ACP methyl ester carboxylesterase